MIYTNSGTDPFGTQRGIAGAPNRLGTAGDITQKTQPFNRQRSVANNLLAQSQPLSLMRAPALADEEQAYNYDIEGVGKPEF